MYRQRSGFRTTIVCLGDETGFSSWVSYIIGCQLIWRYWTTTINFLSLNGSPFWGSHPASKQVAFPWVDEHEISKLAGGLLAVSLSQLVRHTTSCSLVIFVCESCHRWDWLIKRFWSSQVPRQLSCQTPRPTFNAIIPDTSWENGANNQECYGDRGKFSIA